jgi:hypothetical protein
MTVATRLEARPTDQAVGARHRRPDRHRRSVEKALAVLVLLVAFAVTVTLLGLQWLGSQSNATSAPAVGAVLSHKAFVSEVQPS